MSTFRLTMYEPPPDRRPYQMSRDNGRTWQTIAASHFADLIERLTAYPDDRRAEVQAGATIRLDRATTPLYVRHTPSKADVSDAAKQIGLF